MSLEGNGLLRINTASVEAYEGLVHDSPYGSSRLLGYDASISGLERCLTIFLMVYAGFITSELS